MVGMNDVQSEVFTLSDAQQLLDYAQGNEDISGLSIWSVGRDNGSTVGTVSPLGSGNPADGLRVQPHLRSHLSRTAPRPRGRLSRDGTGLFRPRRSSALRRTPLTSAVQ